MLRIQNHRSARSNGLRMLMLRIQNHRRSARSNSLRILMLRIQNHTRSVRSNAQDSYAENPEPQKERSKQRSQDSLLRIQNHRRGARSSGLGMNMPRIQSRRRSAQSKPLRMLILRIQKESSSAVRITMPSIKKLCSGMLVLRAVSIGQRGHNLRCLLSWQWTSKTRCCI